MRGWGCLAITVLSGLMCHGCRPVQTGNAADVNPAGWMTADTAVIRIDNTDTAAMRTIVLMFRTDSRFDAAEIPVTISVETPDSVRFEEKFTAVPSRMKKINKTTFEASVPFRRDVAMPQAGTYTFRIATDMDGIRGVWGVGVSIDRQ